jgi:hypothetical protein
LNHIGEQGDVLVGPFGAEQRLDRFQHMLALLLGGAHDAGQFLSVCAPPLPVLG